MPFLSLPSEGEGAVYPPVAVRPCQIWMGLIGRADDRPTAASRRRHCRTNHRRRRDGGVREKFTKNWRVIGTSELCTPDYMTPDMYVASKCVALYDAWYVRRIKVRRIIWRLICTSHYMTPDMYVASKCVALYDAWYVRRIIWRLICTSHQSASHYMYLHYYMYLL